MFFLIWPAYGVLAHGKLLTVADNSGGDLQA